MTQKTDKLDSYENSAIYILAGGIAGFIDSTFGFDLGLFVLIIVLGLAEITRWIFSSLFSTGIIRRKKLKEKDNIKEYIFETILFVIAYFLAYSGISSLTLIEVIKEYNSLYIPRILILFFFAYLFVWFKDRFTWKKLF